jgi:hypothetical protein
METDYKLKMAVISGASKALKLKSENPKMSDDAILQTITTQSEEVISQIDEE